MPKGMLRWHLRNRLAMIRESRGLTQAELAKLIGSYKSTIASWEIDRCLPPEPMIARLMKILHCRRHDIFPFE